MKLQLVREPLALDALNDLCRSVGWKPANAENYNLAVANSVACVSAFLDSRPVGSGRLVGDVGMYLYIQDVIVHGELHKRGIGSRIVEELHQIAEQLDCRRDTIGLVASLDVCDFYEKLGYAESAPASKFLVRKVADPS